MFRINLDQEFESMRRMSIIQQFQMSADSLFETYDTRDVNEAVKYAKDNSEKIATDGFDDCMLEVKELFIKAIEWLEKNGRKI
jgi:hypothetical protein